MTTSHGVAPRESDLFSATEGRDSAHGEYRESVGMFDSVDLVLGWAIAALLLLFVIFSLIH